MKALPSKPDLRKWMADNSTGYKKASEHFGVPAGDLRAIMGANASRTRGGARDQAAKAKAQLDPLAWRRDKLVTFEQVWATAAKAEKPNIVGMAALSKSMMALRTEIDKLAEAAPDDMENATAEEIREALGMAMEEWPNEHLELAFRVYSDRLGGRLLFIHEGGTETEYTAEDGWRPKEG